MRLSTLAALAVAVAIPLSAQEQQIDTQRSTISIHVGKTGLLAAAAHEHDVDAPVSSGVIQESGTPHIEFRVETAKMKLRPDPKIDAKDQATIQTHMEELVLETKKFPEISFRSSAVRKLGEGQWKVDGALTLHGVTKQISLAVKKNGDAYATHFALKQTDYGITPITVAGGIIKVKDEVQLEFRIFARP
jgi:polyisoprenoid-binding protein YceI